MPGAGDKSVQLERQKRPIACAAALMSRAACQHQECLQLGSASRFVASGLNGQTLGSVGERHGLAT
jgi:hypothetical protein